jgi:hypothetical protein
MRKRNTTLPACYISERTELIASHRSLPHVRRKDVWSVQSKVETEETQSLETPAIANWQSILCKADGPRDRYCEAVAALNVKVICELAPLTRDRLSYESFQQEAVALALSIQDELFRSFALKQVKAFFRRAAAHPWREPKPNCRKTPFMARDRPKWLGQG